MATKTVTYPDSDNLPVWAQWKGEGPAPAHWWSTNPTTGERTKIYRSYKDYIED